MKITKVENFSLEVKNQENKFLKNLEVSVIKNVEIEKIATVIKWQRSKKRLGTHTTKDVSEISYSTRKIRKQKGGGCARARNKGAPHFRGGATIFGPDGRKYTYSLNKKVRLLGLKHAISLKIKKKQIIILDKIDFNNRVKSFKEFKSKLSIKTNSILMVDVEKNSKVLMAINNLSQTNFLPVIGINVLSILKNKLLICTENVIDVLKKRGVL